MSGQNLTSLSKKQCYQHCFFTFQIISSYVSSIRNPLVKNQANFKKPSYKQNLNKPFQDKALKQFFRCHLSLNYQVKENWQKFASFNPPLIPPFRGEWGQLKITTSCNFSLTLHGFHTQKKHSLNLFKFCFFSYSCFIHHKI